MAAPRDPHRPARSTAIVGGGWAGMAAAIAAARAGDRVTVFESARTLGGRARAVPATLPDGRPVVLDNGQHILIGAYTETLRLMRLVGVDESTALLRMPLALRFADGSGLQLPDTAPPWDAALGIARARGWSLADKAALLRTAGTWRLGGFRCAPGTSVAQLCATLTPRLRDEFIDPLCVSALNTPAHEASGSVFLRVLRDSLFSGRGGSNLLLPRTDLGALLPEAAARWLQTHHGAQVLVGQRIAGITRTSGGGWEVTGAGAPAAQHFDHLVLATPPWEASRLLREAHGLPAADADAAARWCAQADALRHTAIATVYAHAPGAALPAPMLALHSGPQAPAQFVFDRAQLGGPAGLLAFVVSACPDVPRDQLATEVLAQAGRQLPGMDTAALQQVVTIVERRATFACTPGLVRPPPRVAGLAVAGDYVEGPYPATLEGAVLAGLAAAAPASP